MIKLVLFMSFQSLFLILSQIFLKKGLGLIGSFDMSFVYIFSLLKNVWLYLSIVSLVLSAVIWILVLKRYDFSIAYPLVSISYIYALIAAKYIFSEEINFTMIIGVAFIILGIFVLILGKSSVDSGVVS